MLSFRLFLLIPILVSVLSACSALDLPGLLPSPSLPTLPKFEVPPLLAAPAETQPQAFALPASQPQARAQAVPGADILPPEVNIIARLGPVKAAVLPALQGLGYKVTEDNSAWTVLTKPSGSRLTTTRLTVTFGSIGPQTRVIADLRITAGGPQEAEPAPDHPDRNAIQARLSQVKAQLERQPAAPPLASTTPAPAPAPLGSPQPLLNQQPAAPASPVQAALPPSAPLPGIFPPSPAPQNPVPQSAAQPPTLTPPGSVPPASASAQPSWIPQIPPLNVPNLFGEPAPPAIISPTAVLPAPPQAPPPPRQAGNPLGDLIPNLPPPPPLPSFFPPDPSTAPPDDRPLRKGQTRVRL